MGHIGMGNSPSKKKGDAPAFVFSSKTREAFNNIELVQRTKLPQLSIAGLEMDDGDDKAIAMIAQCTSLKCLDLSNNNFKAVPLQFATLTKLKELVLSKNKIQALPDQVIGVMLRLETLSLDQNALRVLPDSVGTLSKLK